MTTQPTPSRPSPVHNVGTWTDRRAAASGSHPAIVDVERSLDYAELHERTLRCAGMLARAGISRGDRVALLLSNRSAYLEVVLAAARLGALSVPINSRFTPREVVRVLDDCSAALLVHEADGDAVARAAVASTVSPVERIACPEPYERALAQAEPRPQVEAVTPDDPMMLMYTSGTTGEPKGAVLPHRKALFNSLNAQLFFELDSHDRVLVMLPLFHSFGLSILALPTLYAGGCVHLEPRFDAELAWKRIAERGISFMGGVPTQFAAMLEALEHRPGTEIGTLRFFFGAGAAIPVEQIRGFERHGIVLKQGFGQTETSILCCLDARDAIRKAGSVGRPVFHAELRVVAIEDLEGGPSSWRDVTPGETGEIVVRGPITMTRLLAAPGGHRRDPARRVAAHRRPGDRATTRASYTLVGRARRHVHLRRRERLSRRRSRPCTQQHPEPWREIAVLGVADSSAGARWAEAYCGAAPARAAARRQRALRAWGAERLARLQAAPRASSRCRTLYRARRVRQGEEASSFGKVKKHELGKVKKHELRG